MQGSTPFCWRHGRYWIKRGRSAVAEFIASRYDHQALPAYERIDLRPLSLQLRLEMQYVLQCRRDDETIKTRPSAVRGIVGFLTASGVTSLLDWPEAAWGQRFPTPGPKSTTQSALVVYARRRIEDLAFGRGWDIEYPRDIWRLRSLGIDGQHATLSFAAIAQPWLKDPAKRWARWRLATGTGPSWAYRCVQVITRFGAFLAASGIDSLGQVDRPKPVPRGSVEANPAPMTSLEGTAGPNGDPCPARLLA